MRLEFEVPGKVASNNRVTRRFGNRSVKDPKAVSYQQRVFQHAFAAAQRQGWQMPEACAVTIEAYNVRLDVDNVCKNVLDGMNGAAYDDDKRVISLWVVKEKDAGDERIVVRVSVAEPLPAKKPKKAKAA